MSRCLTCGQTFPIERAICPSDGDVLVGEGKACSDTGRVLANRYRLGNLLGEGGMGRVLEASRLDAPESVAVKLLKESAGSPDGIDRRRMELEAEAASRLDHPGAVKVIEHGRTAEGESFIVMERLQGATFDELRRAGKLSRPERAVELLREVCEVLEAAHARGIVHRDLKPSNLFLHRPAPGTARVKVLDFGIAKVLDRAGERLTSTGEFLGTLLYMAPEQIEGRPVTAAMDVYALGVILFEALAGRVPFAARTPVELLRLHATRPAPALSTFRPDVSDELEAVVARCLMKKPENRYREAGELGRALGAVRPERPGAPLPEETKVLRLNPARWVGVTLEDRYEIQEWIGPGRFGSDVYRAIHLRAGASVAVRLWRTGRGAARDALLDAWRREARAMEIRHPNLIAILDLGFNDECVYMVTELVESISLRTLLARKGPLPEAVAVMLARGAAEGLGALHAKGIVSGGLSPETMRVVMGADGPERMLLTPFGITGAEQLEVLAALRPESGEDRFGEYIAPEQRRGGEPDGRSDLYSLGVILLEMLGDPPPAGWEAFLERALAADRGVRYPDARTFVAGLG